MENTYQFKGKFKELKSKGYKFWKAYAHNYKVYTKRIDNGCTINVWVAHGGYIEYNDLYSHTSNFFEALKNLKDEDFLRDRVHIVFDWDDYSKKPEVHQLSRMMRGMRYAKEQFKDDFISDNSDISFKAWEKAMKVIDGDIDKHEIVIHKETRDLILKELKLINSY